MRGVYTASISFSATTGKTLLYLQCPATAAIEILSAKVTNRDIDTNEQMTVSLKPVTTIGTPADASIVLVAKHEAGDAASLMVDGTNLLGNLTTEPTTYANPVDIQGVPSLGGYRYEPVPEERPTVAPSKAMGLVLESTIVATTLDCEVTWREIA